jgi:outer membrane protein TolC
MDALDIGEVLRLAIRDNFKLRMTVVDVSVSEAQALAAMGAFDWIVNSGLNVSRDKQTPRGSQFFFSTGSRTQSFNLGVQKKIQSGGTFGIDLQFQRSLSDQPISIANPGGGSNTLANKRILPRFTFNHPLLRGFGVKLNRAPIERAKLARSSGEAAQQQAAQELVRDLLVAYWDLLFAKKDLENKRYSADLARQQLARTQAQVRAGRLAAVEAKSVEQAMAARDNEVISAEQVLLDRSVALRTLMGQDLAAISTLGVLPATDPVMAEIGPLDISKEIELVLANNPQVRQLELALATKRYDDLEAANARLPQLDLALAFSPRGVSIDTAANNQSGKPSKRGSWGEAFKNFATDDVAENGLLADFNVNAGLTLQWDIENRGALGRHQQVRLEVQKAQLNLAQLRQTQAQAVIQLASTQRSSQKREQVARVSVELAEDNLAAEQARFRVGRSTNYDVLLRIDALSKARTDLLNAQVELLKAKIRLQALNGEILSAYGISLASRAPSRQDEPSNSESTSAGADGG